MRTAKAGQEKERVRMRLEVTLVKLVMESVVLEPARIECEAYAWLGGEPCFHDS